MAEKLHLGIDYGTKLGGSTAICYVESGLLYFVQSEKKKDADLFINQFVHKFQPSSIYLDAPLSLPSAYFGVGEDFFYRKGDREVKAMSPMFIGGLTARAMKLKASLIQTHPECFIYETYPGYLARNILQLKAHYNKRSKALDPFLQALQVYLPLDYKRPPANWHQVDAMLAWISGYRHAHNESIYVGDEQEGQIII